MKKWQPFFEIQVGGDHHFQFLQQCISDVTNKLQIEVPMFPLILVTIGQIVKKWQPFFKIQDGGSHHLEKYTSG